MNNDYIKVKKVIADFVEIKGTKFVNLFLNDEKTLIDLIKTIDKKWVETTEDEDGLFSKEDKKLLLYLKETNNLSHLNVSDLPNLENYQNVKHIVIEKDSCLELDDYKKTIHDDENNIDIIEQGVKLSVNDNIMKLLKFNSTDSNIDIKYNSNLNELLITQKRYEFNSDDYKTNFTINHKLNSYNLKVVLFVRDENLKWTEEYAKVTYIDENNININFTEAVKCKVLINKI